MTKESRGIRNNNPGNIRRSTEKWQGLAVRQSDVEFFTFEQEKYGIRAIARILINYQDKYGINTPKGIISRWAPPVENNTGAYVAAVCRAIGVGENVTLNMHNYAHLMPLVKAIIKHENGKQPYGQDVIDDALKMAGVVPLRGNLSKQKEVQGATIAGAGITLSGALDAVQGAQVQIAPLVEYGATLRYLFIALALAGVGLTIYARIKKVG